MKMLDIVSLNMEEGDDSLVVSSERSLKLRFKVILVK